MNGPSNGRESQHPVGMTLSPWTLLLLRLPIPWGQNAAWNRLIEDNADWLVAAIRVRLRRYSLGREDLAMDIAQDTWSTAFDNINEYRSSMPFMDWLIGLARRHIAREDRRRRRSQGLLHDPPDTHTDETELEVLMHSVIASLRPKHREAVVSFYFEGESISDIAKRKGISDRTVKRYLEKGREDLRVRITYWLDRLPPGETRRSISALMPLAHEGEEGPDVFRRPQGG